MQGRLRGNPLTVTVDSACAHCGAPLSLEIDSDLNIRRRGGGREPLLFRPLIDFGALAEPSIIDAF